jgi:hypothetical protein
MTYPGPLGTDRVAVVIALCVLAILLGVALGYALAPYDLA